MNPSNMPGKIALRTVTRAGGTEMVCDYIRPNGSPCTCEGVKHDFVESVRLLPTKKRNPAMADAIRKAGLR